MQIGRDTRLAASCWFTKQVHPSTTFGRSSTSHRLQRAAPTSPQRSLRPPRSPVLISFSAASPSLRQLPGGLILPGNAPSVFSLTSVAEPREGDAPELPN